MVVISVHRETMSPLESYLEELHKLIIIMYSLDTYKAIYVKMRIW